MQKYFLQFSVLLILGFFTRFIGLGAHSFVNNELYIMLHFEYLEIGFQEFFQSFFEWEIHPPLNHFFTFYWGKVFGYTEVPIRSLSALFSFLSLILIFEITRVCYNTRTALLALLLLILNFPAIMLGRIATSYGWLIFYSLLSLYLFLQIHKKSGKNKFMLFSFVVSLILSSYTHYLSLVFSLILLTLSWMRCFWVGQKKSKIFATSVFFLFYSPWIPIIFRQYPRLQTHDYPRSLGESPIFDLFYYFCNKNSVVFILALIFLGRLFYVKKFKKWDKYDLLFSCLAIGPILIFYILSLIGTEIWNLHYFALTIPFWIIIISNSISNFSPKLVCAIAIILVTGISVFDFKTNQYDQKFAIRIPIRETVVSVIDWHEKTSQSQIFPVLNHSWSHYIFGHFFKRYDKKDIVYIVPDGRLDLAQSNEGIGELLGEKSKLKYKDFWLMNTYNPLSPNLKEFIETNYLPVVEFKKKSVRATLYKARVNE